MGYGGLDAFTNSDRAADMYYDIVDALIKATIQGFNTERFSGSFNTGGAVNLALIIRSDLFKNIDWDCVNSDSIGKMQKTLEKALQDMDKLIAGAEDKKGWDDDRNRREHLHQYKRMRRELNSFLETGMETS